MARQFVLFSFLMVLAATAGVAVPSAASEFNRPAETSLDAALFYIDLGAISRTDSAYDFADPAREPTLVEASQTALRQLRMRHKVYLYTNTDIQRIEEQSGVRSLRPFVSKGTSSHAFTFAAITPPPSSSGAIMLDQNLGFLPNTSPEVVRRDRNLGVTDWNFSIQIDTQDDVTESSDTAEEAEW